MTEPTTDLTSQASSVVPDDSRDQDVPGLNEALGALQMELVRLKDAAAHIDQSKEAAEKAVGAAMQLGKAAVSLAGPTQELIKRLDKIDFPARLDKLDATVSTLGVGLQNLQGRMDGVERNVKDDLRAAQAEVKQYHEQHSRDLEAKTRQLEQTIGQHAARQGKAIKHLQFLMIGTLVGVVVLVVLMLLT